MIFEEAIPTARRDGFWRGESAFLDAEGRYILWNKKYAEIYKSSAGTPARRMRSTSCISAW